MPTTTNKSFEPARHPRPSIRMNKRQPTMLNPDEIQLKVGDPFIFRRFEKIDWKKIASVNVDQLKGNTDWAIIESNMRNVLCCHVESEFADLDPNLSKLFQLAQISVEYLLHARQQTLAELKICKEKLVANTDALHAALRAKEEAKRKLKEIKRENRESAANNSNYYRCPACSKTFLNGDYLRGHWQRRHPELVTVANTPQPVVTAPPVGCCAAPVASETSHDVIELKMLLQSAEKQLQTEQQLLQSLVDKVDQSNVSLRGVLVQEVEKIRASLVQPETPKHVVQQPATCRPVQPESPPRFVSTDVQTVDSKPAAVVSSATNTDPTADEPVTKCSPKKAPVKLVRQATVARRPEEEDGRTAADDQQTDEIRWLDDDEAPAARKINSVDREKLVVGFKSTIQQALRQRMSLLGIAHRKSLSPARFRRIMNQLDTEANKSSDYRRTRRHFDCELRRRLAGSNQAAPASQPMARKKMPPSQPAARVSKVHSVKYTPPAGPSIQRTAQEVAVPRAPVPTPRMNRNSNADASLMARDGEATAAGRKVDVQDAAHHLERQVKPNNPVDTLAGQNVKASRPIGRVQQPRESPRDVDGDEDDDDSFSLSSLDAMLNELKRPNRFQQQGGAPSPAKSIMATSTGTPASTASTTSTTPKTVQWRVPVETMQKPIDHSWDS